MKDEATLNNDNNDNNITMLKSVLAVCIFLMGLASVVAPQKLVDSQDAQHWFSLGNMAASGVLLAGGLVHMLADSASVLDVGHDFPMAHFVAGFTFIGFLVLEESLHLLFMMTDTTNNENEDGEDLKNFLMHSHDHGHDNHPKDINDNKIDNQEQNNDNKHHHPKEIQALLSTTNNNHHHHHEYDDHSHDNENHNASSIHHNQTHNNASIHHIVSVRSAAASCCVGSYTPSTYSHAQPHSQSHSEPQHHSLSLAEEISVAEISVVETIVQPRQKPSLLFSSSSNNYPQPHHPSSHHPHHPHHHHDDHVELHLHGSMVATIILMMALSIHSILAGVSIGIEATYETIASTAIAIVAHKSFEGFCLGSSLVSANLEAGGAAFWGLCIGFALATPLGILMGQGIIYLTEEDENDTNATSTTDNNTAIAIVKAMVAGTFLYISIVEIGGKELLACRHDEGQHGSKWQKQIDAAKLLCFVMGYLAMSGLALFV